MHTGVRPYCCPVCEKSFSRNTNLTKHMRIHSQVPNNRPFICQHCPRSYASSMELQRHNRAVHTAVDNSKSPPFHCTRCEATFASKLQLQQHEQTHGNAMPLNSFSALESEFNPGHILGNQRALPAGTSIATAAAVPQRANNYRNHTCQICFKTFRRERDLQRHQALHLDTLFTCKECGTGFSRREKLARHELEAHGPQYACNICGKTYHKRDEYELHMKVHKLQQNVAFNTQAALHQVQSQNHLQQQKQHHQLPVVPPHLPKHFLKPSGNSAAADLSFYSQMVPTMNLGFYSETRPEE